MLSALVLSLSASLPLLMAPQVRAPQYRPTRVSASNATAQPVRLTAEDKVQLGATYYAPKKLNQKNPAVLLVHDAGQDASQMTDMAIAWQKRGFAVLALDLRGHGSSRSELCNWKTSNPKQRDVLWAMAKRDLSAASAYLKGRREVHHSRIIAAGKGAAAGLVLAQGIDDPDLAGVVLISPPSGEDPTYGFNLSKQLRDLEGLPTLIVCGREGSKNCTVLATQAHEANDGYKYITVTPLRCEAKKLLQDRRLHGSLTTWTKKLFTSSDS
jgi:dienelactone hydrolase